VNPWPKVDGTLDDAHIETLWSVKHRLRNTVGESTSKVMTQKQLFYIALKVQKFGKLKGT